jgi:hypothetical protein
MMALYDLQSLKLKKRFYLRLLNRGGENMEQVQDVKLKLQIQTDKRFVEKEFGDLFALKVFMDGFFSELGNSETPKTRVKQKSPQQRIKS